MTRLQLLAICAMLASIPIGPVLLALAGVDLGGFVYLLTAAIHGLVLGLAGIAISTCDDGCEESKKVKP